MEFEFDKEIDAILRKARTGETVSAINPKSEHLDADEISAFAENALPEKTKRLYTAHLADCGRCRKILSNTILLNSEAEFATASSAVAVQKNSVETSIPWYRKLFLFPQLTYVMGALVLAFGGFLAYLVLQNTAKNSEVSSVSQIKERPQNMSGASSDGETTIIESSRANSNAGTMQTSANSAANFVSSQAASNSAAISSNTSAANSSAVSRKEPAMRQQDERTAPPTTTAKNDSENAVGSAAAPAPPPAMQAQPPSPVQDKSEETRKDADKATRAETLREKKSNAESGISDLATAGRQVSELPSAAKPVAKVAVSGKNKQAGSKNFTRKNGVWYDANYTGQSTINVSRGSDDYRKLDTGLRSIADSLSGTVVVVWKDKAYRIQ